MKVFVTGATGFIGSFLTAALVEKGYQVRCLVRNSSNLAWISDLDVDCHFGSLDDLESLGRGLWEADYVYHLAGVTKSLNEKDYYYGNLQGTKNLVDTIISTECKLKRFVHMSSQAAVGPSPTIEPINEQFTTNPINVYGKSKLAAENYLKEVAKKIPTTIIRPSTVYGPRDKDILQFIKTIRYGIIPKLGGRDKYLSLIYITDLVQGIIKAAEHKKTLNETYFLSMDKPLSWEEFSEISLKIMGKKGFRINVPEALLKGITNITQGIAKIAKTNPALNKERFYQMQPDFWICSPKKATEDFGFKAETTIENGIRETIDWYVRNNWL